MARTRIVDLGFKKAVEAIDGTEYVYYKHGVWNPYELRKTDDVKKSIMESGYGADIYKDEDTGMFYVSIPSAGDMW